ncbi:MAG: 3'(2'),5'-bisphosphate nucleotidase CysQ [Pseudomonadota bacterium]
MAANDSCDRPGDPCADDCALLVEALREVAPAAMKWFRAGAKSKVEIWKKGDGSSVTAADMAVNEALKTRLLAARPGYGWLSEEDDESAAAVRARRGSHRVFMIDPIDGTRSFIEGSDKFCFSAAVVEDGAPIAGAIYAPASDTMYEAALGEGAWRNDERLGAERAPPADPPTILAPRRDEADSRWRRGAPPMDRSYLQPLAHRLCVVAAGEKDGLITLKDTNEWDLAAADLIAREAGLTVTDRTGRPIVYNKVEPRVAGVLAGPASLHSEWLAHGPDPETQARSETA